MLVGTMEEVDAFLHTTPWGTEHTIGFNSWILDDEPRWSVFLMADPGDLDSEGIVFAYCPERRRAALVGCGSFNKVFGLKEEIPEQPYRDIRALALLLKRDLAGSI